MHKLRTKMEQGKLCTWLRAPVAATSSAPTAQQRIGLDGAFELQTSSTSTRQNKNKNTRGYRGHHMYARYLCSDPIELLVLAHLSGEDVNLSGEMSEHEKE